MVRHFGRAVGKNWRMCRMSDPFARRALTEGAR